ncbi:blue copper protein 1a-like [Dioscorea cayenensis subsp. rotundata]|uniref:Blue copper protein 1a-like n=1 Tax=Dioscorea cayennensis subsp. rotundata TaxID=55577 RepID=A0AB40CSV7_DIOCR|nr:blue copper protein 1a-like [Dioscorea cayenensis subsp. rotundata]
MASKQMLVVLAIVATILPVITTATVFTVGDEVGWSLKGNYTAWAMGKEFKIGDSLVFNYTKNKHNVLKISGDGFKACDPSKAAETLNTGMDVITLAKPGKKWYICGFSDHCSKGMKLVINVGGDLLAPTSPPTAPAPASFAHMEALSFSSKLVMVALSLGMVFILF